MTRQVKYADDYSIPKCEEYIDPLFRKFWDSQEPFFIDYEDKEEQIEYPCWVEYERLHLKDIIEKEERIEYPCWIEYERLHLKDIIEKEEAKSNTNNMKKY